MLKKMILQILICIVIYTIFYMVQNTNYIFSEDVIKKVNEILSYDININVLYEQGKQYVNGLIYKEDNQEDNKQEENNVEKNQEENSGDEPKQEENTLGEEVKQDESTPVEEAQKPVEDVSEENEGVGGENIEINKEEVASITQAEQDAKDVIETVSLISPLKGTITSRFGPRESDNPIVSKYHTGIDIAVNEGTVFTSAMSGTVTTVSSEGAYRKSCGDSFW